MTITTYDDFKSNQTIAYGSPATSASANKAPLFIKKELNALNNYFMIKLGESPLDWDSNHQYFLGDYCTLNGVIYKAHVDNINNAPNSSKWDVIDIIQNYRPFFKWNSSTSYKQYDVVIDNNNIYEAENANIGNQPPSSDWYLIGKVGNSQAHIQNNDLSSFIAMSIALS